MRRILFFALLLSVGACSSPYGPWVDGAGRNANGVNEFPSRTVCDEEGVTFLTYNGMRFANDPLGLLGPLTNDPGLQLSFGASELPRDRLFAAGVTHTYNSLTGETTIREILVDLEAGFDYLYVASNDGTIEQWPRAEDGCPSIARLSE